MSQPLSAADRSAITAEQGPVNMAMGAVIMLEDGPGVEYEAVCRRIAERVHLLPRYTMRLQTPTVTVRAKPNDFLYHSWVPDENFDVHMHVRYAALPAPGGDAELAEYVGREFSRRIDRTRSPWEVHLVRGLSGNRAALVLKMHHALVDGMAALGIGMVLLDTESEPPKADASATDRKPGVALHRYLAKLATTSATKPARALWDVADRYLLAPTAVEADLRKARDVMAAVVRNRASAPWLPINRTISANRSYAFGSAEFGPLRDAGKAAGGTVNDAVLAAVAGMLNRYLPAAGVDLDRLPDDPVALVPVSTRQAGDASGGNRLSIVFIDLPVREPDPLRRVALVNERTRNLRGSPDVIAGALMVGTIGYVPPMVTSALSTVPMPSLPKREGGKITQNLVVSNIPGPKMPLFFNGVPVLGAHPIVPLNPANQGMNVGVFSYNGTFFWGLTTDRALTPGVDVAATALREALDELTAAAKR